MYGLTFYPSLLLWNWVLHILGKLSSAWHYPRLVLSGMANILYKGILTLIGTNSNSSSSLRMQWLKTDTYLFKISFYAA